MIHQDTGLHEVGRRRSKLLFAVDHIFEVTAEGEVFTVGGKFPYSAWETYLESFDEIVVISRARPARPDAEQILSRSSGPRVRHCLVTAHRGWKRLFAARKDAVRVGHEVGMADAVIGRIPSELGLSAARMAARQGKPYLLELVACPWDALWNHGSPVSRAYAPILTGRTRAAVKRAPFVRYVTASFLQGRYPTKGKATFASNVMLKPIPGNVLEKRSERFEAVNGATGAPLVLGTIGALQTKLKGVHVAFQALAEAKSELPPFIYRVLGEGDPAELQAQAAALGLSGDVQFDGVLPADEVARWLDAVDVYLQPSFQEGLPRGLIEALGRGCLAAGSTAGGIPELLPPERLHKPGDAHGLAISLKAIWGVINGGGALDEVAASLRTAARYDLGEMKRRRIEAVADLRTAAEAWRHGKRV
ncbi:glycosyltransferase family 4 protein [Brevundimonas sp. TSRC1-1]|uniref:glycosyltransferase family 4 protein n=1 Tax=Brevundimonas sp. TSRC1-1 TaxID=2804562 RepID=UPI003CECA02D